MYSKPIYLTHELILCIQIARNWIDYNGDFALKILAGTKFWPRSSLLCSRCTLLSGIGRFYGSSLLGPFKCPAFLGIVLQQSPASCLKHSPDFPRACVPWKSLPHSCLAYMLPQRSPFYLRTCNLFLTLPWYKTHNRSWTFQLMGLLVVLEQGLSCQLADPNFFFVLHFYDSS